MTNFFTSDTHWNHANVIKYCKRPYLKDPTLDWWDWNLDVPAMNESMIQKWNSVVKPEDRVFHLGDLAMGPGQGDFVRQLRPRLNGSVTLILGNHDKSRTFYLERGFEQVNREWRGNLEGYKIWMQHHPPERPTAKCAEYDYILCGHVHDKWKRKGKVINVGVDQWDFTPRTLEELIKAVSSDS